MEIWKFPVPLSGKCIIEMPIDAEILSFQSQNDVLMLWAAVWPNSSHEERKFSIVGTGQNIDMDLVKKFIGTAQLMNGRFVWHLFEMKK